ncbi:MAG TPA: PPOX class F420-dependent oxidoreductase [Solirubrobacterales bacterium]|jgi:PPOX class probable F420-dependent enzyme|nr:PPOX class F420-dependent oxidoreductase [Solirubrobacterales bacterium]
MAAAIPDEAKHLFENKDFAHVATLNSDGSPQVSAVWIGLDGDLITFNTAEGRLKPRNLRRDERVAVSIAGQENPYENLIVQGKVVELTNDGADEDIDALAKRYLDADSYPYRQPGEERLIIKIEPEKVNHTNP